MGSHLRVVAGLMPASTVSRHLPQQRDVAADVGDERSGQVLGTLVVICGRLPLLQAGRVVKVNAQPVPQRLAGRDPPSSWTSEVSPSSVSAIFRQVAQNA